jgi:hypothetical protein
MAQQEAAATDEEMAALRRNAKADWVRDVKPLLPSSHDESIQRWRAYDFARDKWLLTYGHAFPVTGYSQPAF